MPQYFALLSVVYMIAFVLVFDRVHRARSANRFCGKCLLSGDEIDQIQQILMACRES